MNTNTIDIEKTVDTNAPHLAFVHCLAPALTPTL
jgi:hypothetical protein